MTKREAIAQLQSLIENSCSFHAEDGDIWERDIEALNMAKTALARSEWISVKDRRPERGGDYLCRCNIDGHDDMPFFMVLRYYIVDKNPHFQHECEHGLRVTHWMPLPEPPEV